MINVLKAGLFIILCCAFTFVNAQQGIITTIIGTGSGGYGGDNGPASAALLGSPTGICMDKHGNIYIGDMSVYSVVRKVNAASGIITTVAGNGSIGYNGDNIPATTAKMHYPAGVAIDTSGNIYISEYAGYRIRKVDAITGFITTIAGTGTSGSAGENVAATNAQINGVRSICLDRLGNIYIADQLNKKVRKVDLSGIITTYAGIGAAGTGGDNGPATAAQMTPYGVAADTFNNIYIADGDNFVVRKVDAVTNVITTVAGGGVSTAENVPATSAGIEPYGIYVDKGQNIFIVNHSNYSIRKINASGIIVTVASHGYGYAGDHGPATAALLRCATGVYADDSGSIYIGDDANSVVRKVTYCRGNPIAVYNDTGTQTRGFEYTGTTVLYDSVRWNFGDGDTSHALNPIHTYTANGTYHACVTVYTDCGSDSACKDIVITHVEAPMVLSREELKIWPNPVNGLMTIEGAQFSKLTVTDVVGKIVYTKYISSDKENIHMEFLPNGVYVVQVVDAVSGERGVKKIVKE